MPGGSTQTLLRPGLGLEAVAVAAARRRVGLPSIPPPVLAPAGGARV